MAERVAAAEALLLSLKAEVADLGKRVVACQARVPRFSSAPLLGTSHSREVGASSCTTTVVFRGEGKLGKNGQRGSGSVPPHRHGPVTAKMLTMTDGEEQKRLVEQWSTMLIATGRRSGAAAMFCGPEDDDVVVAQLTQLLKRFRITKRCDVRHHLPSEMTIRHPNYARGRRRIRFLMGMHGKRWHAYTARRSLGGLGAEKRQQEDPTAGAPPDAYEIKRALSSRPQDVPDVDWDDVVSTENKGLETLMALVGAGEQCIVDEIKKYIAQIMDNEGESNTQIKAMSEIRKMLSREKDPPINEALHAKVLPVLVRCIEEDMPEEMLMETAWVITNICSGLAVHCQCVVAVGLIPRLICLVSEPTDTVAQQAAWALGNVAGDSAVHRDICLKSGILLPLEQIVSENVDAAADDLTKEKRELMRNVAWVCSNLMRGKDPRPNMKYLAEGARWIGRLVGFVDTEVVRDAVWALSYIADGSDEQIALLTQQPQLVEQVVDLLAHADRAMRTPALRTIGNIGSGSAEQTQLIVDLGVLDRLPPLLSSDERTSIRKEAMWLVSNITAGTQKQIQAVLDSGLMPEVLAFMIDAPEPLRKEAVWAASNFTSGCDRRQLEALLEHGFFEVMVAYTESTEVALPQVLEGLKNSFELIPDVAAQLFSEIDGFSRLAALEEVFDRVAACEATFATIMGYNV